MSTAGLAAQKMATMELEIKVLRSRIASLEQGIIPAPSTCLIILEDKLRERRESIRLSNHEQRRSRKQC
jgi:hypothetical protein